ncbi:peroxin 11C, partial [Metarhizium majus ARSEF 297]
MSAADKPSSGVDTSVDAAVPPSLPPPSNQKAPITAVLAAAPSRADALLAHLLRCMQTRSGAETVLLFACYTSRLTGSVLEAAGGAAIRQSARRLVALAFKLPPATTVVMSSTAPRPSLAALALQLGGRFKALAAMISETRTMGRLWGLLGLYFAAKRLVLKSRAAAAPEKNKLDPPAEDASSEALFDTLVAYAQIASLIVFQASENVAFLSSKKVLPFAPATQARLGLLSVRAWGLYVAMEGARLLVERGRRTAQGGAAAKDAEWAAAWNKSFYRNLAWAPLTVHWGSTTGGFLPDMAVSLLAFYPASGAMVDLWRSTA